MRAHTHRFRKSLSQPLPPQISNSLMIDIEQSHLISAEPAIAAGIKRAHGARANSAFQKYNSTLG